MIPEMTEMGCIELLLPLIKNDALLNPIRTLITPKFPISGLCIFFNNFVVFC